MRKVKLLQLLKDKIGKYFHELGLVKMLKRDTNILILNKTNKWMTFKIKNFCSSKYIIKRVKR